MFLSLESVKVQLCKTPSRTEGEGKFSNPMQLIEHIGGNVLNKFGGRIKNFLFCVLIS